MTNAFFAVPGLVLGVCIAASPGFANEPPPFPEFSAKRIGPPKTEGNRRITIQIDPEEQARVLAPPKPPEPEPERPSEPDVAALPNPLNDPYVRFWAAVSPKLQDANPARLEETLAVIRDIDGLSGPRLGDMKRITDLYGSEILRETVGTKVSPALVAAVISVESAGQEAAVSSAGAVGLMQLMPDTAERFGVSDRTKPGQSIKGGVAYLNWLMSEFGDDPLLILAGYNAGEGAVIKHEGIPPYAETRAYVPKVLAAFQVASGLCRTPPQFISDPCVFVGPS